LGRLGDIKLNARVRILVAREDEGLSDREGDAPRRGAGDAARSTRRVGDSGLQNVVNGDPPPTRHEEEGDVADELGDGAGDSGRSMLDKPHANPRKDILHGFKNPCFLAPRIGGVVGVDVLWHK
jgi:hypothetical protein